MRADRLARRVTRLQSAALGTVLCGTVALAGSAVSGLTRFDLLRIEKPKAPIEDQRAASLSATPKSASANTEPVDAPQPTAINKNGTSDAAMVTTAAGTTGADRSESIVETALAQSSQKLPAETPPVQMATRSEPDAVHTDTGDAVKPLEAVECLVPEICVDQYLWSLYQRTPKRDTIKVEEQRKITVKKKGKTRTRKTYQARRRGFYVEGSESGRKSQHVIEGLRDRRMDRSFKLKLYHALRALDEAGLSPGITSAFRDDYRQSLVSGLKKAASDRSYHGGSLRGGYGHGLAVDLVSVKGETRAERSVSSESLWRWIDEHGKEFGLGRPYLDKDPPHVAPIDSKEYVDYHREVHGQQRVLCFFRKRCAALSIAQIFEGFR
jgi:D-alanyl-D-alanine carboxypeptidase